MESTRDMDGKALQTGWERQEVRMVPCREVWRGVDRFCGAASRVVHGCRIDHRRSWVACMGNSPVIRRGCFFMCGDLLRGGLGRLLFGPPDEHGEGMASVRCGDGERFLAGWDHMGVAICEDVAGFGRPAVRRKAGSVRSAHGSADPWPFFGMDV